MDHHINCIQKLCRYLYPPSIQDPRRICLKEFNPRSNPGRLRFEVFHKKRVLGIARQRLNQNQAGERGIPRPQREGGKLTWVLSLLCPEPACLLRAEHADFDVTSVATRSSSPERATSVRPPWRSLGPQWFFLPLQLSCWCGSPSSPPHPCP